VFVKVIKMVGLLMGDWGGGGFRKLQRKKESPHTNGEAKKFQKGEGRIYGGECVGGKEIGGGVTRKDQ